MYLSLCFACAPGCEVCFIPENIVKYSKKLDTPEKEKLSKYQVKYIHNISKEEGFIMKPNVINFQKIKKGEVIGFDIKGEVLAPSSGKILMPLYQEQGKEGFYIIQHEN